MVAAVRNFGAVRQSTERRATTFKRHVGRVSERAKACVADDRKQSLARTIKLPAVPQVDEGAILLAVVRQERETIVACRELCARIAELVGG